MRRYFILVLFFIVKFTKIVRKCNLSKCRKINDVVSRLRRKKSGDILFLFKKKKKRKEKKSSQTQDKSDNEVIQEAITLQFLAILPRMVWIKFKQYRYLGGPTAARHETIMDCPRGITMSCLLDFTVANSFTGSDVGFAWQFLGGVSIQYFVFTVLSFGPSSASYIFTKFL